MTRRQARLSVDIFTAVVVASVAIALANLTWRLAGEPGIGPAAAPVMARGGDPVDVTQIVALAPFGTAIVAASGAATDGSMTLKAIFLAFPMEASTVLLATADGSVASYGVGSAVGGGVIETIEAEQITLRTNGRIQTLGFNPQAAGGSTGAPAVPPVAGANPVPPASPAPAASFAPSPPAPASATGAAAIRALIPEASRGRPAASAPSPRAEARATSSGSGYQIGASLPPALAASGLQPGDLVQSVNGRPVGAGTNPGTIAAEALARGSARVDFVRAGQRNSLTIPAR